MLWLEYLKCCEFLERKLKAFLNDDSLESNAKLFMI